MEIKTVCVFPRGGKDEISIYRYDLYPKYYADILYGLAGQDIHRLIIYKNKEDSILKKPLEQHDFVGMSIKVYWCEE